MSSTQTNDRHSWWRAAAKELERILGESTDGRPFEEMYEQGDYKTLAKKAWNLAGCEGGYEGDIYDFAAFLEDKQRDYGCGNINKFGRFGLQVRLWDKIARYNNLASQDRPRYESLQDTLLDIVGYVVLWCMVHHGTFDRPVRDRASLRAGGPFAMEDEYGNEFPVMEDEYGNELPAWDPWDDDEYDDWDDNRISHLA